MTPGEFRVAPVGMRNGLVVNIGEDDRITFMVWDTPDRALEMTLTGADAQHFITFMKVSHILGGI